MLRLALDRVRIESGQIWIRVGLSLGHSCLDWIGSGMNRFDFGSFRVYIGSFRVQVYIG